MVGTRVFGMYLVICGWEKVFNDLLKENEIEELFIIVNIVLWFQASLPL